MGGWNKGKCISEWMDKSVLENRNKKISQALKGKKIVDRKKGYHLTKEHRLNISRSNKKIKHTVEWNRKVSQSNLGKQVSGETKLNMSDAQKLRFTDKKNHPMYGKHFTKESRKKMSDSHKKPRPYRRGIPFSKEARRNMSLAKKGKPGTRLGCITSQETKYKQRISRQRHILKTGNIKLGKHEKQLLDELEKLFNYKIIRQYPVDGYFIDGYIKELNLAIEIDEKHHFVEDGIWKTKDLERACNIDDILHCRWLRIRDIGLPK